MSRMLDLVRACALPSHQMMSAARGALHLPEAETVEILVHLAEHNKIFAEQARMTLAAWDEVSSRAIAANPETPSEVLEYWLSPKNFRPALFPLLIENPSVTVTKLSELAATLRGEWIDIMLTSARIGAEAQILTDMSSNKNLNAKQTGRLQQLTAAHDPELKPADYAALAQEPETVAAEVAVAAADSDPALLADPESPADPSPGPDDAEAESALVAFFAQHAKEIAADANKPFQAIGGIYDEILAREASQATAVAAAAATGSAPVIAVSTTAALTSVPAAPGLAPLHRKLVNPENEKRGSALQKISGLDVKGRIQLAMKGNKEERSILVRDGTKIVALAVLDSPKITDGEVEKFASQKNVLEAVLRAIPMKRRFVKNYAIVRNLTFNPRTPIDVSLGLTKNLLLQDLRHLAGNKEVSETVRKVALRMFKQKASANSRG
jgi:hypothetical protein